MLAKNGLLEEENERKKRKYQTNKQTNCGPFGKVNSTGYYFIIVQVS